MSIYFEGIEETPRRFTWKNEVTGNWGLQESQGMDI